VLIPRPETELLVETAIAGAPRGARLADIGTGTGCVAISVALARPDLRVVGIDVSIAAAAVAARNRDALHAPIDLVASDLLSGVDAPFDIVLSNPPYISAADMAQVPSEVRHHEPLIALSPGPRGTEIIERILGQAGNARVMMEIGLGQEPLVRDLAASHGFEVDEVRADLAGIPRVVVLSRHGWK
jgi:release factor glutamine methyltransferase